MERNSEIGGYKVWRGMGLMNEKMKRIIEKEKPERDLYLGWVREFDVILRTSRGTWNPLPQLCRGFQKLPDAADPTGRCLNIVLFPSSSFVSF